MKQKHYLFSELKNMYLKGEMIEPENPDVWMIFYLDEEAEKKGESHLTFSSWADFKRMMDNKPAQKLFKTK